MSGSIFMETLRRNWRAMLYWGIGLGVYGYFISSFVQDANMLKQYSELTKSLPPAMLKFLGTDSATLATPEGFLGYGFFGYALLIMAVYSILAGLNVTANEEDQGIMDVLLSLPLPRWRIVVEKFLAYALMIVVIIALSFVGLYVGNQASAVKVDISHLGAGIINILPGTLLMLAFTMFVAVLFRTKGLATATASFFLIGSYLLNFLGQAATGTAADQIRGISFFYYYDYNNVLVNGLNGGNILLLVVIAALLFGGSIWLFQRRDVGV